MKVRVLGTPGTGFGLSGGRTAYAGEVVEMEDAQARRKIRSGDVVPVEAAPAPLPVAETPSVEQPEPIGPEPEGTEPSRRRRGRGE